MDDTLPPATDTARARYLLAVGLVTVLATNLALAYGSYVRAREAEVHARAARLAQAVSVGAARDVERDTARTITAYEQTANARRGAVEAVNDAEASAAVAASSRLDAVHSAAHSHVAVAAARAAAASARDALRRGNVTMGTPTITTGDAQTEVQP